MKIIIRLTIVLLLAPLMMLQANTYWNSYPVETSLYYEWATPGFDSYYKPFAGQSGIGDMSNFYLLSEITYSENLLFANENNSDEWNGWTNTPYGEVENALKIPVKDAWEILIVMLFGYAALSFLRSRRLRETVKR